MKNKVKKGYNPQRILFLIFLLFILYIYGHLVYLTMFNNLYGINMKAFASNRNTVKTIVPSTRGNILDTNGKSLAETVTTYKLIAFLDSNRTKDPKRPAHVVDKELTASKLSEILGMDKSYALKQLNQNLYQTYFGNYGSNITELVKDELQKTGLPGLGFEAKTTRTYPNGDFASYIVGYAKDSLEEVSILDVKENLNTLVGELGIEAKYNKELTGVNGYLSYQKSKEGYKIPDTKETEVAQVDGSDIYLTIDSGIQRFVESGIATLKKDYNPEWAIITVMDAKTGDILASGTAPSFNPNLKNITNYQNPLVSYTYEPGSTMKIYSYLCAIDDGSYKATDTIKSGSYKILDDEIFDWEKQGWGEITYDKGFEYSSNVAAAHLVRDVINKAKYNECLEKYGFGKKTNIELTKEQSGTINFNYPLEVVAASYGQGITTTPIQHLQAFTLISNHGRMLTPHIVSKIVDSNGVTTYERQVEETEQIVKESSVNKMKDLLNLVINSDDKKRTGILYANQNTQLIGKTGTAQYYDPKTKVYTSSGSNYVYSFAGMFPYDDPSIIIYAAVKKPVWGRGQSVAKLTNSVVNSIVTYKNMNNKEETVTNESKVLNSYLNTFADKTKYELETFGAKVIVINDGNKIIDQYPLNNSVIVKGDKVFLKTNGSNNIVPNLKGWSRTDVTTYAKMANLELVITGNGYVTSYSVTNNILNVTLKDKYNF